MRLSATMVFLWAVPALAQSFPADGSFVPLRCGNQNMFDALRDQPGAVAERDLVGDEANPAGLRAADSSYLYLRMRLDADPAPAQMPRPFAWGFALDLDDDATDYEALIVVDGNTGRILLHRNTTTSVPNSPADPADQPPLATAAFAGRARSIATGSNFGATGDSFLDVAVPWTDLALVSVTPSTPVRVWVGTSTNPDRLDDDIACHDGSGGGAPSLLGTGSGRGTLDPNAPGGGLDGGTTGGGDGGVGPGQTRSVEGGPGCSLMAGLTSLGDGVLLVLLLVAALILRRATQKP